MTSQTYSPMPMTGGRQVENNQPKLTKADRASLNSVDSIEYSKSYFTGTYTLNDLRNARKTNSDLPQNMWGVTILVLVEDLPLMVAREYSMVKLLKCAYFFALSIANVSVQVMLVHWGRMFITAPSVNQIQGHYLKFHQEMFNNDGEFNDDLWGSFEHKASLCEAAMSQAPFLCTMLMLWTLRILIEVKEVLLLAKDLWDIPSLPDGCGLADMTINDFDISSTDITDRTSRITEGPQDKPANRIIALTRGVRFSLYAFVVLPRLGIALYLLVMGCQWLSSTEGLQDLILNALAMEFIFDIDELIFEALFPKLVRDVLEASQLEIIEDTKHSWNDRLVPGIFFNLLCGSLATGWVLSYYFYLEQVLPNYGYDLKSLCYDYFAEENHMRCSPFQMDCFPYGSSGQDA